jgi:hypothetical protein
LVERQSPPPSFLLSDEFGHKAKKTVGDQEELEPLQAEQIEPHQQQQDAGHAEMKQALVNLRGMTADHLAVDLEGHTPGQVGWHTAAATVEETAPAADRHRQGQRQRERVAGFDVDAHDELHELEADVGTDEAHGDRLTVVEPRFQGERPGFACQHEGQFGAEGAADERGQCEG